MIEGEWIVLGTQEKGGSIAENYIQIPGRSSKRMGDRWTCWSPVTRMQGSAVEQILSKLRGAVASEGETVGLAEVLQHKIIIEDGEGDRSSN